MPPNWNRLVRERLAALCLPPEREIEIVEEVSLHLEAVYEDALAEGLSEAEAEARVMRGYDWRLLECELGRAARSKLDPWLHGSEKKNGGGNGKMDRMRQHLRFALRTLRKQPGFSFVVILTLSLGIGANTAIFSLVNAVLLRDIPYIDNPGLVYIETGKQEQAVENYGSGSPADFWDWQAQSQAFAQLAAMVGDGGIVMRGERAEWLRGPRVSANFFDVFQARPILGRSFRAEDGLVAAPETVILSYRTWQNKFGGDPNIIGRMLDDNRLQVIGVMPEDFTFPEYAESWIPLLRDSGEMQQRRSRYFQILGRINPGQTLAGAQAELKAVAARLALQYPDTNKNITVNLTPLGARRVRDVKLSLLVMLGAVVFVLLIACVNVANLLLARAATRRREFAIRAALGASRGQMIAQVLIESLVLAIAGGAGGLLLAVWGKGLLVGLLPSSYSYLQLEGAVHIDRRVLLFTLAASLLTGFLFGLLPALRASRVSVNDCLKDGRDTQEGAGQRRTRSMLVVAEIALALVLLTGAGLLIGSLIRLQRVDLGFAPTNLFVTNIDLSPGQYPDETVRVNRIRELQERVAAVPGVDGVAVTTGGAFPYLNFTFNRVTDPFPTEETALYDAISPNYFRVLQSPLLTGREFSDQDQRKTPPVAIINERFARRYFPNTDPINQLITVNYLNAKQRRQIVGVVKDNVQGDPGRIQPQLYIPVTQQTWFSQNLLVRSSIEPALAQRAVEAAITSVDPKYLPAKMDTPAETLAKSLAEPRLYTWLLGSFAAISLLMAAVGIYGIMSYSVAQRTHEIGLRVALGAQHRDVFRLVLGQGIGLAFAGILVGLLAAAALTRFLDKMLFGVSATDPITFAGIALGLLLVACLACWLPARRAMQVDPLTALRGE